jgi:lipoprotein-anchoring transpeptidase ErfK/SrfK
MDSGTLALDGRSAHYRLEHVRWTQYFTADGKALHENYWKPGDQIGIPSSHGCIGVAPDDAQFLWDFATVGTPIYVHQ